MSGLSALSTQAPGKINLCLFVGGTRAIDGRHELVSVMQAVDLCDTVAIEAAPKATADVVRCPGVTGANIAAAALDAFRSYTGVRSPVRITITKAIPVAAGMAGGSADAGAVLRLMDEHCATGLDDAVLRQLAASLGADVPAQVRPGRHLATGAGERIQSLRSPAPYGVVVLAHSEPLPTPAVYREFDRLGLTRSRADLDGLAEQVWGAAADLPAALIVNDLEAAAVSLCLAVDRNLKRMRATGAEHALVAGSGPTVLGLTRTVAHAADLAAELGAPAVATQPWPSLHRAPSA